MEEPGGHGCVTGLNVFPEGKESKATKVRAAGKERRGDATTNRLRSGDNKVMEEGRGACKFSMVEERA